MNTTVSRSRQETRERSFSGDIVAVERFVRLWRGTFPDFGLINRAKSIFGRNETICIRFCSSLTACGLESVRAEIRNQLLFVTVGALKADVTACFLPDYFKLASGGVSCSHDLIVNLAREKSLLLAFSKDYQDNPAVLHQLAKPLKVCLQIGIEEKTQNPTKILGWSRAERGIDDALANGKKIYILEIGEWFSAPEDARAVVQKVWAEV